jgi:hypothetical protein
MLVRYKLIGVMVALLVSWGSAMAASEMEQRWVELRSQARESGNLSSEMLLDSFFGFASPDFPDEDDEHLKWFLFPDLSDTGWEILAEARRVEADQILEDQNFKARLFEAQCDLKLDDAYGIANAMADIEDAVLQRKLDRYSEVFDKLSDADKEQVRIHNLEHYGGEFPQLSQDQRNILLSLATEFPDVYLARYAKECESALANRGRPFRRVVEKPAGGCSRTYSDGSGTIAQTECMTWVSYTQEPEESDE